MYQVSKILIFLLLCSLSEGCQWSIEAEQGITFGTITYRDDTMSSNNQTVRLSEGQYIIWGVITESSCTLQVLNVEYINDGLSYYAIILYIDGQQVGTFDTTRSDHEHLGNESVSSGPIGDEVALSSGNHTVKLAATDNGIEVDRMILALICTNDVSNSDEIL
jgi:hypothetical protein